MNIAIPPSPSLEDILSISRTLNDAENIEVDFSRLAFLTPATALLLSSSLRARKVQAEVNPFAPGYGYAAHVGFFEACGVHAGQAVGAAPGSDSYTPLRRVACNEVKLTARRTGLPLPASLTPRAENLARVVAGGNAVAMRYVTFAVREILRNCVEHARSIDFWYAGQFWPKNGTVEIAILDEGDGIRTSLNRNPENPKLATELDAIRFAIQSGVSGVPKAQRRGDSANSGYGLYLTRRLCAGGSGSFGIVSNGEGSVISTNGERQLKGLSKGTLLQLRMDTDWLSALTEDDFKRIIEEGEREARERTGAEQPASGASRGLP